MIPPLGTMMPPEPEVVEPTRAWAELSDTLGIKPPLELTDIIKEFEEARGAYEARNSAIRLWRNIIRLSSNYAHWLGGGAGTSWWKGMPDEDQRLVHQISQPASMIRDYVRAISGLDEKVEFAMVGAGQDHDTLRSKMTAVARQVLRQWERDHHNGGESDTHRADQVRHLAEDGQLFERLRLAPDRDDIPLEAEILDPLSVYPIWGRVHGKPGMKRCYHLVRMTAEQVRDEWGASVLPGVPNDTWQEIVNFSDENYIGVFLLSGAEWLKEPTMHGYGCQPVKAAYINGWKPGADDMGAKFGGEWARGRSVIADHVGNIDKATKLNAALDYVIELAANPPWKERLQGVGGQNIEIDPVPGGKTTLNPGEDVVPLFDVTSQISAISAALAQVRDAMDADHFASAVKAAQERANALDRMIASDEADMMYRPVANKIEVHLGIMLADGFKMLRGMSGSIGNLYVQATGPRAFEFMEVSPEEFPAALDVKVRFNRMGSSSKQMQAATAGAMAINAGVMSRFTFIADHMGLDDPDEELARIDEDMALRDPSVIQATGKARMLARLKREYSNAMARNDAFLAEIAKAQANIVLESMLRDLEQAQSGNAPSMEGPAPGMPGSREPQGGTPPAPAGPPPGAAAEAGPMANGPTGGGEAAMQAMNRMGAR